MRKLSDLTEEYVVKFCRLSPPSPVCSVAARLHLAPASARSVALSWQLCGAVAYKNWKRKAGAGRATFLTAVYLGAFGAAHPLRQEAWRVARSLTL